MDRPKSVVSVIRGVTERRTYMSAVFLWAREFPIFLVDESMENPYSYLRKFSCSRCHIFPVIL